MVTSRAPDEIEVEWQLDALDLRPVERWFAALSSGAAGAPGGPAQDAPFVVATPRSAERLVDAYYDTADWRIGRSGHVLRVRHRGTEREITLKSSDQAKAGLRRRLEVTEALPEQGLDALGPGGPVGWRLRALAGKRPLQQVLEVRTRRRPYDLRCDDKTVAEAALDETVIVVGEGHQPMRLQRVEVEVEPAWVEHLTPLVETLRRDCGLQPATLSKFEAGLLAAGVRIPPPPELGPTSFPPNPSVGEVAFAVLRRSFASVLAHEAGTRLGEDSEELHDMRVATRRSRAALAQFQDALPVRARHLRIELGWLAEILGAVRDLDVQLERLDDWLRDATDEERVALMELATLLHRERDDARRALLTCLDSARYERLVAGFTTMLRQGPSRRSASARTPAVVVVPDLVESRHRAASKAARRARRTGEAPDFHRTRIRVKRLRYLVEFVSEIYDKRTAKFLSRVVKVQDALGLMQDAQVAAERLHRLVAEEGAHLSPLTVFVMGGIAERYREEAGRLAKKKAPDRLRELGGDEWHRLNALMERRRLELSSQYRWPGSPAPPAASRPVAAPLAGVARPSPVTQPQPVPPPAPAATPSPSAPLRPPPAADEAHAEPTAPGVPGQARSATDGPVSAPQPTHPSGPRRTPPVPPTPTFFRLPSARRRDEGEGEAPHHRSVGDETGGPPAEG